MIKYCNLNSIFKNQFKYNKNIVAKILPKLVLFKTYNVNNFTENSKFKIYTKTGDKGHTSTLNESNIPKSSLIISLLGTFDEFNSLLGVIVSNVEEDFINKKELQNSDVVNDYIYYKNFIVDNLQINLIHISSYLASNGNSKYLINDLKSLLIKIENNIDSLDDKIPPLNKFIIPGGCKTASLIHFSRTICRRLERELVNYIKKNNFTQNLDESNLLISIINRISDLMFNYARYINHINKTKEYTVN